MMFMIRFMLYFSVSFVILSFPTNSNEKVFDHLDRLAEPYTSKIHKKINGFIKSGSTQVANVTNKIFNNTSEDKINSRRSSTKRKKVNLPQDNYTVEEREALLNILRQN